MPNLRKPVYSAQIGSFMDTPERAATLKAWAEHLNITHGAIMRDVLDQGLADLLRGYESSQGVDGFAEIYDRHLAQETARGEARAVAGAAIKRESRLAEKTRKPTRKTRAKRAA
jgi:hypothetical protein